MAKPSEVSHVLFNRAYGWTPSQAAGWLESHGFRAPKTYENLKSEGGERLAAGSYIVYRVAPKSKKFTSFGYSDEVSPGGVWFKFGGYRGRRKAGEKDTCRACENRKGYLRLDESARGSVWLEAASEQRGRWTRVPGWGSSKVKIPRVTASGEVREIVDDLFFASDGEVVVTPKQAAKVIAWAKTLPGWREGFVVFRK